MVATSPVPDSSVAAASVLTIWALTCLVSSLYSWASELSSMACFRASPDLASTAAAALPVVGVVVAAPTVAAVVVVAGFVAATVLAAAPASWPLTAAAASSSSTQACSTCLYQQGTTISVLASLISAGLTRAARIALS